MLKNTQQCLAILNNAQQYSRKNNSIAPNRSKSQYHLLFPCPMLRPLPPTPHKYSLKRNVKKKRDEFALDYTITSTIKLIRWQWRGSYGHFVDLNLGTNLSHRPWRDCISILQNFIINFVISFSGVIDQECEFF